MIEIGSTVGNYRVDRKLGSGSMGSVYLAEHPMIGKRVALKVIHSDLADNEEMVSRFFNEARAVTLIGHENIIEVIDFGQTPDGENFIVMELLEGRSLGDRLKAEPILPLGDILHIATQIAEGLEASHQRGIIHRDLKPDNVYLIDRNGDVNFVKILDFGLAKLTQGGGALSHKTRAGSVLGTPHYMAPEQCEGKPDIDHRVDVYALGCMLYQCLCGRVPFPGEGFGEVLVKHLREPPVMPSKLNADIPREIEAVILHALAKRKEFRFQSMREMGQALREPERWAREAASMALIRATGEMESVLGESAEDTDAGSPPAEGEQSMPTALDREVPPEVASLGVGRAGAPAPPQAATMMLETPELPISSPNARTAMGVSSPVSDSFSRPAPSHAAKRFMIVTGAAAVSVLGVLGAMRLWSHETSHRRRRLWATPVEAAPTSMAVMVQSVPSGADILQDGQRLGATPMLVKLPAGTHLAELTLRKAGYVEERRMVHPELEPQLTVRLHVVPPPPPPPPLPVATESHSTAARSPAVGARTPRPAPVKKSKHAATPGGDDLVAPTLLKLGLVAATP